MDIQKKVSKIKPMKPIIISRELVFLIQPQPKRVRKIIQETGF